MTNPGEYIQRLEAENLKLQDLLKEQERLIKDASREAFSRGFRKGLLQSEGMSEHVLAEWRGKNTIKYPNIFK